MESKKRTLQTMSPLKIGNVEMQNPLVLAPMAGVTDLPFRDRKSTRLNSSH